MSGPNHSGKSRRLRIGLALVAAGAITFGAIAEGFAQRGGFGGRGFGGGNFGGRMPGGDGPRNPGGGYPGGPGFPGRGGGIIVPGGYGGPGTVVVVDDDDDAPVRHGRRKTKKQSQKPQKQQKQMAQRGGFHVPPANERRFVPNEVLLNISTAASLRAVDAIAQKYRLTRLDVQDFTLTRHRLARLRINDGRPVAVVIRSLRSDARVLGAQPNYLYAMQQGAAVPAAADPAQYSLAKLHLPEAHALAKGNRVLVAVVDTPIDAAHPDLAGVVEASFDATGAADKPHAHGTGIASVIAAHGKLTGAAPAVRILAAHAFSSAASSGTSLNILKGLDWAGKLKANIVNMSFAGPADAELHEMLTALRANGAVLVAAVGNAGPKSAPLYPAADPSVIAVTATDMDDKPFSLANRGTHIAVAAPGVNILAAAPDGGYQMPSGTSFAAAQISGIAALLLERNPKLDAAAVRRVLMATARDLGPPGHDDQFGSGLADALAAVNAASPKSSDASAATPAN
ncbi:MAG: S8 family serine peptidase [Alphaproteobacteria bacterium]